MESDLEIVHVEGMDAEVRELIDALGEDFPQVQIAQTFIIAGDGIGFNPATLQLIVEQVGFNVLANLIVQGGGKVWGAISRAARKGKGGLPDDWPPALAITVRRPDAEVQFSIWPALGPEVLPEVLRSIPQLLEGVPQDKYVEFWYGPRTRAWGEPHELPEHDAAILRQRRRGRRQHRRRQK